MKFKKAFVASVAALSLFGFSTAAHGADALFVNVGPIPRGVTAGVPQTVFQFVHSGTPSGPTVAGVAVSMSVVSGPNSGQKSTVVTDVTGQALWRFQTGKTSPVAGGTDVVLAWIDTNKNGLADSSEPQNTNPFFTLPSNLAVAQDTTCDGRTPTVTVAGNQSRGYGTGGPDVVSVTADNATVYAGDGDDVICSWAKNTKIYAANGNDKISVYGTNASVWAEDGDDTVTAMTAGNSVWGSGGNDRITFGNFGGSAWGGEGDDTLVNGVTPALLSGENGNDRIVSETANGNYWGGNGDNTFAIAGKTSRG